MNPWNNVLARRIESSDFQKINIKSVENQSSVHLFRARFFRSCARFFGENEQKEAKNGRF